MKAKWIGVLLTVSIVIPGLLLSGCKCKSCETAMAEEMAPTVVLPEGYVVMKGLCDADYDNQGWPRYIMNCKDGSIMALVPETCYTMGMNGQEVNEGPQHRVVVGKFYIDMYEINNAQFNQFAKAASCLCWKKDDPCLANELLSSMTPANWVDRNSPMKDDPCLAASVCRLPKCVQLDLNAFKDYWTECVNNSHPARNVSFWEAWYYCRWAGKDLPTEAEWELAAKGPEARLYPWGNTEPDSQHPLCNYDGARPAEDGFMYTSPVSAFASGRSPFGCYNMAGNVWEWCKDYYDATAYSVTNFASRTGRQQAEANREFVNPTGPDLGDMRVIRGGAYTSEIADCRTTVRRFAPANYHGMNIGFRGVLRIR